MFHRYDGSYTSVLQLLVTDNVVTACLIHSALIMDAIRSPETSGVPSQKTVFFIVPAVKTSNLT
jgi:hypothetical protein